MSLNGALQIGRSAIVTSQAGLQVAGNNMANAATPGYSRQVMRLAPLHGDPIGRNQFIGRGVDLVQITRQVDTALQGRYRDALAGENAALINQRFLGALESIRNELTDNDVSTLLSEFFNSFSEAANNPQDHAVRSLVIQRGATLAERLVQVRTDTARLRDEIDRDLNVSVTQINGILDRLEQVNAQIVTAEGGGGGQANALRDQRDMLVDELAQYLDVTAIEQPNGMVDVLVGSTPIMLAGRSRGVSLRLEAVNGDLKASLRVSADQSPLTATGGRVGGLLTQRTGHIEPALAALDDFAGQLIEQVNRLHSQGQGKQPFASLTGTTRIPDATVNLNHATVQLPFRIENGSFLIHVTHAQTGARSTYRIDVNGDAMTLNDLMAAINATVPNVTAGLNAERRMTLDAATGYRISFSDDSSGALASLGINTFFSGRDATDIAVNAAIENDPGLLALGSDHEDGSNGTALAIAGLQDAQIENLGGRTLREFWQQTLSAEAVKTAAAEAKVESTRLVRQSIEAQMQAVSGVSLDEEAINLMAFQRQFQAAARFISVIDESIQTLLAMV